MEKTMHCIKGFHKAWGVGEWGYKVVRAEGLKN